MPFVRLRWLNSLSIKVLLAFIAGVVLSITLIVLSAILIVRSQGDVLSGKAVAERAKDLSGKIRFDSTGIPTGFDDPIEGAFDDLDESWQQQSLKSETAYRVLDASGNVALSSAAGEAFWAESGITNRVEPGRFQFVHGGVAMRGATACVEHDGKLWFLQFAASTRFLNLIYRDFALPFAGVGIVVFSLVLFFVFGVCGYVTLRFTLKPLREISDSAAAISPHSLNARLQTDAVPAEIEPLVGSFNRVLERLEQGYRIQQEFLATAAHELKTPLTLIRSQIELGVDEKSREALLQDVSHMSRQVQQLLHLAEASEPHNYELVSVDAESLIFEVMNYLERIANQRDVKMQAVVEPGLTLLRADRGALFTLLKNLLENAIQYSPRGGRVTVQAEGHFISVQDEGSGVSHADLPNLFKRFWRSKERRDVGAGLGLSICQEIATVHGWDLQALRKESGMCFELRINRGPPPDQAQPDRH